MTNSIATAKCPSALTSGNYGMSQNRYTDESKEYIFVKLTDSAYRAIEEYQHNENTKRFTNGQRAKIQVNGNSGVIFFPTLDSNEGRKFGFTIDDVEGSLECIQHTAEGLDVLGSIPYRMRIHANDDIYDTTRTKMAIAEETEKSKCIREIKPNQTDIGRKVKKSVLSSSVYQHLGHSGNSNSNNNSNSSNYLSSLSRSKLVSSLNSNSPPATQHSSSLNNKLGGTTLSSSSSSSRSPNPTLLGGSGTVASGSGSSSSTINRYSSSGPSNIYSQSNVSPSLPSLTSASSLSSTLAGGIANGYASAAQHNSPPESATSTLAGSSGKQSRLSNNAAGGNGGNFPRSSGGGSKSAGGGTKGGGALNANSGSGKLPDISRRKIRERLIHLLALRPFKKPELYSRLQNEGLRDRERSLISNILKDIATLSRDNTYNLRRQMWNDVNENWPYYTEQELQQLKRRKPQNLTPPLSSDAGSSTSGQSPTSIHTGSPPPLGGSSGLNGGNSLKRTSLEYDEPFVSAVQPKKQRISHFKKDAIAAVNTANATGSTSSCGASGNGSRGGSYGGMSNSSSGGNAGNPMQRSKHPASASNYSPQGPRNAGHTDENSGNSDLSYNVLNNMDDFMLNIEQQQGSSFLPHSSGSGAVRKSNSSSVSGKTAGSNPKENRYSGGSSSSSNATNMSPKSNNNGSNIYNAQENEAGKSSSMKHGLKRATLAGSPKNALPYGVNFVPESSSSTSSGRPTGRDVSSGSNNRGGGGNYRRQSPSYLQQQQQQQLQQKSSNSVIYSPKMQAAAHSSVNEREDYVPTGRNSSSNRAQATSRSVSSASAAATTGSRQQQRTGGMRTPTPPIQEQQQLALQHQTPHYQLQQTTHSASTYSPVQRHNNQPPHYSSQQQPQQQQQSTQFEMSTSTPQHSAITHDKVDADEAGEVAETPSYDFSNYTAITSIEQRRQYKTEFERDYDEYRQLLERIEDVRRNFQVLADQLQRAPQGCSDYEYIKQQIVAEYERINNEEELKRDKQRFDYLHAKLAHIKQLVTDYDKTLTSMAAAAAAAAAAATATQHQQLQPQQREQEQQQHASATAAMHLAADAACHLVDGSSNVLTASAAHTARVSPMVSGSESNHSPPGGYQQHQQQQQAQHYEQQQQLQQQQQQSLENAQHQQQQDHQQYAPQHKEAVVYRKKKHHSHSNVQQHEQHKPQQQYQYGAQQLQLQQEQFNGHVQHQSQHLTVDENNVMRQPRNNNNNDTDSDDSSDSNDDDDDSNDDDGSNDDDDDDGGSDSNSNDEDDDEHDHERY